MTAWSKSFHTFSAGLRTAAVEWRLRQNRSALAEQERAFDRLQPKFAVTSYWREAGIEPGMTYSVFASRIAPRTHEQLAPAIERMKRGEADVLWPGKCSLFAVTPGTTGAPKSLPVTEELLAHFRQAGLESLLYYTVRMKHAGVFRGRHLFLGGTHALQPIAEAKPHLAYAGDLSSIAGLNLPAWMEKHLHEPGPPIAQIDDWEKKLNAIVARTRGIDISLLAGIPGWVLELAAALRDGGSPSKRAPANLQSLWPNLECFVHGGVPIGPFYDELRAALGPTVNFHEVYPASEGFIAAQDLQSAAGLRLMTNTGIFFEFLPMDQFDATRLDQLAKKIVPLAGVKPGVDYALLLTTPAGLVRYVLGDIVRFISTEPPRLIYVGRTALQLSAFGERVIEKELTDALVAVCSRSKWSITNFHVAPRVASASLTGADRGRHEWWIELKAGTVATPIGPQIAAELDTELMKLNPDYAAKRRGGMLDTPFVRLVMPGVFQHWLTYHKQWGGQHKLPRCCSDRGIADELAQVTNFAVD